MGFDITKRKMNEKSNDRSTGDIKKIVFIFFKHSNVVRRPTAASKPCGERLRDDDLDNIAFWKAPRTVVPALSSPRYAKFSRNMSLVLKVALIIIPMIVRCVNVNTVARCKDDKELSDVYHVNSLRRTVFNELVHAKPYNRHSDFLWRCLDKLKRWKKRRRIKKVVVFMMKENLHSLRWKRSFDQRNDTFILNVSTPQIIADGKSASLVARFKEKWPVRLWKEYGLFTEDYLLIINPHWLQFSPPLPVIHYTLGGIYIIILAIGCSGNMMVLYMYYRYLN